VNQPPVAAAQLAKLLQCLWRHPEGASKGQVSEELHMGRMTVHRRLKRAVELGLVRRDGVAPSTGGRAPARWSVVPDVARLLVLNVRYRSTSLSMTDLRGRVLMRTDWPGGIMASPAEVCDRAVRSIGHLREQTREKWPDLWGMSVTVPSPVDAQSGLIVPPVFECERAGDWPNVDLRAEMESRVGMPVVLNDEIVALALSAARRPGAPDHLLYVRVSLGLGLGIVSGGNVQLGVGGVSGEFPHVQVFGSSDRVCTCGRTGCLETYVSGLALECEAMRHETLAASPALSRVAQEVGRVTVADIVRAAAAGDPRSMRLISEMANRLGAVLAVVATIYPPGEIVIGGEIAAGGSYIGELVEHTILGRLLPAAASRIRVRVGGRNGVDEIVGAAHAFVESQLTANELVRRLSAAAT